jgi:hypothetical protein
MSSQEKETDELRVEHVLAALDQITAMCGHVRTALGHMDPKHVIRARTPITGMGPSPKPLGGQCHVHEAE